MDTTNIPTLPNPRRLTKKATPRKPTLTPMLINNLDIGDIFIYSYSNHYGAARIIENPNIDVNYKRSERLNNDFTPRKQPSIQAWRLDSLQVVYKVEN